MNSTPSQFPSTLNRTHDPAATSWVAKLHTRGVPVIARKLGEEAVETVIATIAEDPKNLTDEAADLIFHLMVVLRIAGIPFADVLAELERRTSQSGIAEKAARKG